METLRLGSSGKQVEKWQSFLRGVGLYLGAIDGVFGDVTDDATQAFQHRHGLIEDGVVGNRTLGEAMRVGLGVVDESADSATALEFPPRPAFAAANATRRVELFGQYSFRHQPTSDNPENIVIEGNWVRDNIVTVHIPQLVGVPGAPASGRVLFHEAVAPKAVALFARWAEAGLTSLILRWEGSFVPRFIRGSRTVLSSHAHGSAFDLNPRWNGLGAVPARRGAKGSVRELVPIANELGFFWGGHFSGRADGMHFELAQP